MHYPEPPKPMLFLARPFVDATLVKGSLKTLVSLPKYLDVMEWVAVNSEIVSLCGYSRVEY